MTDTKKQEEENLLASIYPDGPSQDSEASLPLDVYYSSHYFSRRQLFSQAAQINIIHSLKPQSMLEVGIGNGIVSSMMRKSGVKVKTVDINPSLKPDIVGSVLDIETMFPPDSFDLISCCEVLEHLPLEHFEGIIRSYSKLTRKYVYLTLPRAQITLLQFVMGFKLPFMKYKDSDLFFSLPRKKIAWEHCWELDHSPQTKKSEIKAILSKYFNIVEFRKEIQNPYHIHIVLRKKNS